jgi:hypothetical protein
MEYNKNICPELHRHSRVIDSIQALIRKLDLLPDDLHEKSKTFQVEHDKIRQVIQDEFNYIATMINNKILREDKEAGVSDSNGLH